MKSTVVYRHRKLSNNEVFYIGIGSIKRPYDKRGRSKWWNRVVREYGYYTEIIFENLSWDDACDLENLLISEYGRKDLGKGTLVNLTDGGEGGFGVICSIETREKISKSRKGMVSNMKGKTTSDEVKNKISMARKGSKGNSNKLVLDTSTGIFYDSIREAALIFSINEKTLHNQLVGRTKNKTNLIKV